MVGTADAKQAHGSPTDPTRDTATQIQVPCQPHCPLGAPYLVRTCDVTAHQSPAGRGGACSRARARARWRARSVQCRLELAVPRRGAPAQMVLVVFTTPQEPRRGLPIQPAHFGRCSGTITSNRTLGVAPRGQGGGQHLFGFTGPPLLFMLPSAWEMLLFCVLCSCLRAIRLVL